MEVPNDLVTTALESSRSASERSASAEQAVAADCDTASRATPRLYGAVRSSNSGDRRQFERHNMFFVDLTPYEYGYAMPQSNILTVGWLARGHVFPMGAVPEKFVHALRRLVRSPENLYRGYHTCEFCPDPPVAVSSTGLRISNPPGETMAMGRFVLPDRRGSFMSRQYL